MHVLCACLCVCKCAQPSMHTHGQTECRTDILDYQLPVSRMSSLQAWWAGKQINSTACMSTRATCSMASRFSAGEIALAGCVSGSDSRHPSHGVSATQVSLPCFTLLSYALLSLDPSHGVSATQKAKTPTAPSVGATACRRLHGKAE